MSAILEVNGLAKKYPKSDFSLHDISFSLPKGSIMGFIGENGAGKTTTINCVLGTLIKDSGSVKMFGREVSDNDMDIRNDIGVVFDENAFGGYLTATNIASVMRSIYSNWDDALFASYLEKFKLPAKKKIKTFSRGMTMKLSLAAALSHHPKLLILDEATGGLDPVLRDDVLELFLDFVQDGNRSIFLSSHITTDIEKIADYVTFIHDGKIVLSSTKDELANCYGVMRCDTSQFENIDRDDIVSYRKRINKIDVLISNKTVARSKYHNVVIDDIPIEEIMLMIIKGENDHEQK